MGVTYYSASALRATAGIPIPTPAPPLPHRASEECGWQCQGCRATHAQSVTRCIWCRRYRTEPVSESLDRQEFYCAYLSPGMTFENKGATKAAFAKKMGYWPGTNDLAQQQYFIHGCGGGEGSGFLKGFIIITALSAMTLAAVVCFIQAFS